jgi:hypothetical protein
MQWSPRLWPMPGTTAVGWMECFAYSSLGPMPERRRSLGVSIEPAQTMTSRLARSWERLGPSRQSLRTR